MAAWAGAGEAATDSEPWLGDAFAASGAEVADAAARSDATGDDATGADVVMLLRDDRYAFEADSRMTHTRRWVYRVLTPAGLRDWSASEVVWAPWRQERPQIRVRVVDPEGGEWRLEPGAVSDLSAAQAGLDGELRLLRAVLPVDVGAVVEEEVVVRDTRPLFAAGVSVEHLLAMPVPVRRGRLTLTVPSALSLRYRSRLLSHPRRREVDGNRVRLTFTYADLPSAVPVAAGLPANQPRHPLVAFSTGDRWRKVAAAYARAVNERLKEPETVRRWLPNRGFSARLDRVADVLEGLRGNLRHDPAELGSTPLLPSPPLESLRRGRGDSEDLAAVLVAALAAEGIPAYLALVRAGYGMDVEPELPGLGIFNHALVYVPAPSRSASGVATRPNPSVPGASRVARDAPGEPIWIDPADRFSRAGELASDRQGRLALVASPDTRGLIRTPAATAAENRTITEIEVFMAEEGPARVVETSTYCGAAERRQRLLTSQVGVAGRRRGYRSYLETAYRAEALGEMEETPVEDLSVLFRLRLEALSASRGWTADGEGAFAIDLRPLVATLPRELLVPGAEPRREDFVLHEPFVIEWRYRIHPPAGMRARALPEDLDKPLGSGRLIRSFRLKGMVVHADFRLDSGPRRITAKRFNAYRDAVHALLNAPPLIVWFDAEER